VRISKVETFVVGAGWRCWIFVKIETDDGLVGWGECSDTRAPTGVTGAVQDLSSVLLGQDPLAFETRYIDMVRTFRSSAGGIGSKAIAGVEGALLDIKGQALGVSVAELLGGRTRDRVRLYWSHCGTTRVRHPEIVGTSGIESWDDITTLGKEVVARGFTALKTNIIIPGSGGTWYSGHGGVMSPGDEWAPNSLLTHIETLIATFRDAVGPEVDINLDLNFNFKPEASSRIAKVLEPYNLHWLEIDNIDPTALRQVTDSTTTKICTGETLIHMEDYLPFFEHHAADTFMIDVPWNGVAQGKKIGDLAAVFQHNVSPHNHYSHLSTFMSAAMCATLSNVRIMEIDVDDVPWKDDLTTAVPEIVDGYMTIPDGPGWGLAINEDVAREHPWAPKDQGPAKNLPKAQSF
jgi:galactonate dehydratase